MSARMPGRTKDPRGAARLQSRYGPWAIVTGASDGIGRACARSLAESGIGVVLVARREAPLHALADELRVKGAAALVLAGDVTDPRFVDRVLASTATLDVGLVVLAAGFGSIGPFGDSDLPTQLAMIDTNIVAVTRLTHYLYPRLAARHRSGLVLLGSIVAGQGTPLQANYAATKAYVRSFGEALRVELRPSGIDVLVLSPGPVRSAFAARAGMYIPKGDSPGTVAAAMSSSLGRRGAVVPGLRAKALTAALATMPRSARTRVMHRVLAGMVDHTTSTPLEHP